MKKIVAILKRRENCKDYCHKKICKQAKTLKKIVGERSELRLHTEWTKNHKKCHKWLIWRVYENQSVLPDRSLIIGKKLIENAKIEKFRCDILGDFQTLC